MILGLAFLVPRSSLLVESIVLLQDSTQVDEVVVIGTLLPLEIISSIAVFRIASINPLNALPTIKAAIHSIATQAPSKVHLNKPPSALQITK